MISIRNITAHYSIRPVLRDVSLEVSTGELVALMGPNGMGKSTLMKVIAGVMPPMRGEIEIGGRQRRRSEEEELEIRKNSVYLPDHPWVPLNRTGREFLLAVGQLYDVDIDRLLDHVDRLLTLFDLEAVGDAPIRTYSNGQKKKIAICSVLVPECSYLFLDEPFTGGLDPAAVLALKRVLGRLAERKDVTVILATQLADIAEVLAHRIALLRDGRLVQCDTVPNLKHAAGDTPTLEEALDRLLHPKTIERIEAYFKDRS